MIACICNPSYAGGIAQSDAKPGQKHKIPSKKEIMIKIKT
jgi:hypothetical protein